LMRGRVNVRFSVIAEWLSEWGITLAITWPQQVMSRADALAAAAQVNGCVRYMDYTCRGRCQQHIIGAIYIQASS
jgi:hypothetical protein